MILQNLRKSSYISSCKLEHETRGIFDNIVRSEWCFEWDESDILIHAI